MKGVKIVVILLFVTVVGIFLSNPQIYMQSFLDGVTVWAYNVLPCLFPFAVMTALAVKFLPRTKRSLCKTLFGVRADGIYLTSLLCGYPVGAKVISEGEFDAETATQLCSFCSSASPVFVVATVGIKLLGSTSAAIILIASHLFSTVANGILFRKKRECSEPIATFSVGDIGDTLSSSVLSVLSVGGLIALFYMLTDMVKKFLPVNLYDSVPINFLLGLLEMTNGTISLCATCDVTVATVLCSFLIAFGGLCVFCQSLAFVGKKGVRARKFFHIKLMQGSFATIVSFVLCKIFLH